MYNIVVFAHNEENHIETCLNSILKSVDSDLNKVFLLANGCTDKTIDLATKFKESHEFEELEICEIKIADKCNAWNVYVHDIADISQPFFSHILVDSDVQYSKDCFPKLAKVCISSNPNTNVVAGMPLSGRNLEYYQSMVRDRRCFFGNLYAMTNNYVVKLKEGNFRLPIGLNWIDSFLTKAANTDLTFGTKNLPERVIYEEGVGFLFESLSPFKLEDIKLYKNRIARYELGKIQEVYLDALAYDQWPENMNGINIDIKSNLEEKLKHLNFIKKHLVTKRLNKLVKRSSE